MTQRLTVGFAILLCACSGRSRPDPEIPPPSDTGGDEVAMPADGRLPRDVRPLRYALELAIDPREEAFSGVATIDVEVMSPTRTIVLHGKNLRVARAVYERDGAAIDLVWAMLDEERGIATLRAPTPIAAGQGRLRIEYGANFDTTLEGLYRVEQAGDHYAYTQMEPLSARRAFPSFDEPSFKTPFDVTLVVRDGDHAIANGPEIASEASGEGRRRVRFQTTEPLPTYLIAFAVGPFDVVDGEAIAANDLRDRPIPLRAVAPRGKGSQLAYALSRTGALLSSLERYFGIAYPYAKLDLIAVPDFGAGAMENAGAITFRDQLLLLAEDAPIRQRRGFAFVTAHELAHQWFGNLVTMAWWDDLWLNEAFATWAETRAVRDTFPEFEPDIAEMLTVIEAMDADSFASARRIREPITSDHDIHNAFDSITYSKGNAILSMFERWLTPDVFQRGVQRYLRAHMHGNATAADFVDAMRQEGGEAVDRALTSFLVQPGVPLVEVTPSCTEGRGELALSQSRYVPRGSRAETAMRWQIPVCVRYGVGREVHRECTLLTEPQATFALTNGCPTWVMPNAEGSGYYRWAMPPEALDALRQRGLAALDQREMLSYADSTEAAFAAGRLPYADAVRALEPLARREERALATAPMSLLEFGIRRLANDEAARARARAYAARVYAPRARSLGWQARPNEDPERQLLRAEVLRFLALTAEDPAVRREAARRGIAYLGTDAIEPRAVTPDLAAIALTVAVQDGGAEVFDRALARLRASTDSIVRGDLLAAITSTRDPALAMRALELSHDPALRVSEALRPLFGQTIEPEGRARVWEWLRASYDRLVARVGPSSAGYLPYVAGGFCDTGKVDEVRAFFAPRVPATEGGPRNLEAVIETLELCAARRDFGAESAAALFAR